MSTGYLLILNYTDDRPHTDNDVKNLRETFEGMGAIVESAENLSEPKIKDRMQTIKQKCSNYSYVAVAYLSHGTEDGYVQTSNADVIRLQKTILIPLCNAIDLDGKLKLLIMQTCRGSYDFVEEETEGPAPSIKYPKYCAKFFATSEGMKAYRTSLTGNSLFIDALCARLQKEYTSKDIISIMGGASKDVKQICLPNQKKQIPCSEHNFGSKKFFFNVGFQ